MFVKENPDIKKKLYKFVVNLYISLISFSAPEPVYFFLEKRNREASQKFQYWWGHVILLRKLYFQRCYFEFANLRASHTFALYLPLRLVYKMRVLGHFAPWNIFGLKGIRTFWTISNLCVLYCFKYYFNIYLGQNI